MKLKTPKIIFGYLKQVLLLVGLIYAFSNCHVKKSVLHFAGINFVELSQKSLTPLPLQGSCSVSFLHKNTISKKGFSVSQTPLIPRLQSFGFLTEDNVVCNKIQIHPAFEFNKRATSYPPIFIVFKNLKIDPPIVS